MCNDVWGIQVVIRLQEKKCHTINNNIKQVKSAQAENLT